MTDEHLEQPKDKIVEVPLFISDDDVKRITYLNFLLLQEIKQKIDDLLIEAKK